MMTGLANDVRQALRGLRHRPGFAALAIGTLALGIGVNAIFFSLLEQLTLRPLPVAAPHELVVIGAPGPNQGRTTRHSEFSFPVSYPMYRDLLRSRSLAGLLARFPTQVSLSNGATTERVQGELVSGNYFEVLGVGADLGRPLTAGDDVTRGGHPVVVLNHDTWRRRFGGDPGVVGSTVRLNGHPMTVIGVARQGFRGVEFGTVPEVWIPIAMKKVATPLWEDLDNRRTAWLNLMGRLRPGVTLEQAKAELDTIYSRVLQDEIVEITSARPGFRERFLAKRLELLPGARGRSDLRGRFSQQLWTLAAMAGVVLLVACANLANLLAARASRRRREIAMRLALGATGWRIARQWLVESTLYALGGAVLGLVVAAAGVRALIGMLPFPGADQAFSSDPDTRLALFALVAALATGALVALLPVREALWRDLAARLREETGSTAGHFQLRWRRAVVALQVALSIVVLAAAGLLARSLAELAGRDLGFRTGNLLTFSLEPTLNGYSVEAGRDLVLRLKEELAAIPGVQSVALGDIPVLAQSVSSATVWIEGYDAADGEDMNPRFNDVSPGFFATLGLPLLRGRDFTAVDRQGTPPVAVVNEVMAQRYFAGQDPIGRRFGFGAREEGDVGVEIVGVVRDGPSAHVREEVERFVYLPFAQADEGYGATFYLRTAGEPSLLAGPVRDLVRRHDPHLPVFDLATMENQIETGLYVERLGASLATGFGALATFLAALGLYGVLAYSVAQRRREMGVRIALGAGARQLFRMVVREGLRPVVAGVVAGLLLAWPAVRAIRGMLWGVPAADPWTFGAVLVGLVVVAVGACSLPAWRATRVQPWLALRQE